MNGIEIFLIQGGIALILFAAAACEGSLIYKINKLHLTAGCIIVALGQAAALFAGQLISGTYGARHPIGNEESIGHVLAAIILFGMGLRMAFLAVKNRLIEERVVKDFRILRYLNLVVMTCVYSILAGITFGFLGVPFGVFVPMGMLLCILAVAGGIYTGYRYGFEQKTKAYIAGAILFLAAGADILLKVTDIL